MAKCRTKTQVSWCGNLGGGGEKRAQALVRSAFLQSVYYFVHLQEFANFKESSGKREKCLSRVRGLLEAGVRGGEVQERAGTG